MSWFRKVDGYVELQDLRQVEERLRLRSLVDRIYPGAGKAESPVSVIADLEVWVTDVLAEQRRRRGGDVRVQRTR